MKLAIVSAADAAYNNLLSHCFVSMCRYSRSNQNVSCYARRVPVGCHPSWYKLAAIEELLPHYDLVLWLDADAMFVRFDDITPLFSAFHDLYISEDANGINCGVMAWRNTTSSLSVLRRLSAMQGTPHSHQEWWEQGALMDVLPSVDHLLVPKHVFNAYPDDHTAETRIIHFANLPLARRESLMRECIAP